MADLEALPVTAAPVDEKTEAKSPTGRRDRAVSFKSIAEAPQGSFSPREVRDPSAAYERINTLRGRGTADGTTANVGAEVPPAQRLSDMTDSTSLIIGQGGAVTAIILPGYIQARGEIKIDSDGKGGDIVKMGVDALVVKTQFPAKGSSEALVTAQVPACPAFKTSFPVF